MTRNKHPEETLELIIDVALELFVEKGYDNTSIQDIINNLGGLSKGAIYHHFKSKEEIFEAVADKIGRQNDVFYSKIRDDQSKTAIEKLKEMFRGAYANPTNHLVAAMAPKIMAEPRFIVSCIEEIYNYTAAQFLQPILEEGVREGSIKTDDPKSLAEVIMTLVNVWMNPMLTAATPEEMPKKTIFLGGLLRTYGIDIVDDAMLEGYIELGRLYPQK